MTSRSPEEVDELEGSRAPFLEHLEELRTRLWRAILGVAVASIVCYGFHKEIYELLTGPLFEVLKNRNLEGAVKYRTVHGAFMFHFKTAILGGIFLGIPIVLYQGWQFIAPGLYKNERMLAMPFVVLSSLCFAGGGWFGYSMVLPQAFDFLLGYTITTGPQKLLPDITIEDYLGFVTKLLLAFGIVFQMPICTAFFAGVGLITHRTLIVYWRYAVVGTFVIAALLTPPDYVTQLMLAGPMMVLYAVSIGIAYVITGRKVAAADALDAEYADEDPGDEPSEP